MNKRQQKNIFFILMVLVFLFRCFVMERVIVSGESMYPSCRQGEVYMSKKFGISPMRYDIVIAKMGQRKVIKRVIGLPGDTLKVSNGKVYINGQLAESEYDYFTKAEGILEEDYVLEKDYYFLMGDNRCNSFDSRNYGGVNIEDIEGVVIFKIYPFGKLLK